MEGLVNYKDWESQINNNTINLKLNKEKDAWCDKKLILNEFENTIIQFKDSIIVISYRDDGIPSIGQLVEILQKHGKKVDIKYYDYKYVLSNKSVNEVLIIAT